MTQPIDSLSARISALSSDTAVQILAADLLARDSASAHDDAHLGTRSGERVPSTEDGSTDDEVRSAVERSEIALHVVRTLRSEDLARLVESMKQASPKRLRLDPRLRTLGERPDPVPGATSVRPRSGFAPIELPASARTETPRDSDGNSVA